MGRISRIIFGTLEEDNLQGIENLIETSANESRKIASLLDTQTEIVESQLNVTNTKIEELNSTHTFDRTFTLHTHHAFGTCFPACTQYTNHN